MRHLEGVAALPAPIRGANKLQPLDFLLQPRIARVVVVLTEQPKENRRQVLDINPLRGHRRGPHGLHMIFTGI
jgi:hypothetical protein